MCTRYYIDNYREDFRELFEQVKKSALSERFIERIGRPVTYSGEVRPTDIVPVIAPDHCCLRR